jgi:hypothetical protein
MLLMTVQKKNDIIEKNQLEISRLRAALESRSPISAAEPPTPLRDHNYAAVVKPQEHLQDSKSQQVVIKSSDSSGSVDLSSGDSISNGPRVRELEEKKRLIEKRLRDAVEENMELRERAESFDEVSASLRATKEVLKNVEARLRESVDENADLRRKVGNW